MLEVITSFRISKEFQLAFEHNSWTMECAPFGSDNFPGLVISEQCDKKVGQ